MLKSSKNYYEILGVTPDVESGELKSIYRRLVRKFHPDVNPDGEMKFKDIMEAYETLCDEAKRKQYDTLNGFFKSSGSSEKFKSEPYRKSYRNPSASSDTIKSDSFEKSESKNAQDFNSKTQKKSEDKPFCDLINDIIDGFSQKPKKKKAFSEKKSVPKKGADIYTDVSITLKESITGTQKTVNVINTEVCPYCSGRKFINGSKCQHCDGKGEITNHQKINVTIPQNVKSGTKLRLSGEGKKGENGGKNGDLYLKITVTPDSAFKIDGNNLICEVLISPFEAVLGGDIKVPSLSGYVQLTLPPMTKSGQIFRISSQGVKKNNFVGDIIVTVKIQIPDSLTDEEINLYTKLKELSGECKREKSAND